MIWRLHPTGEYRLDAVRVPADRGHAGAELLPLLRLPELAGNWDRFVFSETPNGFYWGTDNTRTEVTATATWSGKMLSGSYTVEVFLPSRFVGDLVSRRKIATYQIAAVPPVAFQLDQNINQSGWVRLGNYRFEGSYRIVLSNETGEEPTTERVVASAVRLTPVTPP